jgi:hypothetical protein
VRKMFWIKFQFYRIRSLRFPLQNKSVFITILGRLGFEKV